jgi:hypothetical protein
MNLGGTMVSIGIGTILTRSTLAVIQVHPNPFEKINFNHKTFLKESNWTLVVVGLQLKWA